MARLTRFIDQSIPIEERCDSCSGSGCKQLYPDSIQPLFLIDCWFCNGTGRKTAIAD
jgi:DnaJ-class molecular chaperone